MDNREKNVRNSSRRVNKIWSLRTSNKQKQSNSKELHTWYSDQ